MTNPEILERFDALYNNIMSLKAPGLDAYEKSIFWNKATLEVLKNHLNPKGNKYGEGFDNAAKRQVEFSSLTCQKVYYFPLEHSNDTFSEGWKPDESDAWLDNVLSITNEHIEVLSGDALISYLTVAEILLSAKVSSLDFNHDGKVTIDDVATLIVDFLDNGPFTSHSGVDTMKKVLEDQLIPALLSGNTNVQLVFDSSYTIERIINELGVIGTRKVIVPLNYIEYDTLVSRPYKYPPRSQAWRIIVEGVPEFVVAPDEQPILYRMRYIKAPAYVDLASDINSEVPEVLHDEILQRAVELAKNAWEGNIETSKTFGERSE